MEKGDAYHWEITTRDGSVMAQYSDDGCRNKWQDIERDAVTMILLRSTLAHLPDHVVFIDRDAGNRFLRYFGRGFLKNRGSGYKLVEYAFCIVTKAFRVYVLSDGRMILTPASYELRL